MTNNNFKLTDDEQAVIEKHLAGPLNPSIRSRLTALRMLHRGFSIVQVAHACGVSRQMVYNWLDTFRRQGIDNLIARAHTGRPVKTEGEYEERLETLLNQSPTDLGYPEREWTVPRLRGHLTQTTGLALSDRRFRDLLHRRGYEYQAMPPQVEVMLPPFPDTPAAIKIWLAKKAKLRETLPTEMFQPYYAWVKVVRENDGE